ncbi:MAG TPA: SRPBCC family protein, partial [Solirubrobacterales bacterium]|nr:SRPBCC family protein [Solirubrobacterales bacterium]
MASYSTSVESPKPVEEAFDYMADFRNAEEWDENTSSVKLTSGQAGQAGSEYEVITGFAGRDMKLSYRTVEVDRPSKVVFESSTGMAKIRDT